MYVAENSVAILDGSAEQSQVPSKNSKKREAACLAITLALKPVTLKPIICIFRIFRVFVSAFSAFLLGGISSDPCFSGVRGTVRIFRIFAVSGSNR